MVASGVLADGILVKLPCRWLTPYRTITTIVTGERGARRHYRDGRPDRFTGAATRPAVGFIAAFRGVSEAGCALCARKREPLALEHEALPRRDSRRGRRARHHGRGPETTVRVVRGHPRLGRHRSFTSTCRERVRSIIIYRAALFTPANHTVPQALYSARGRPCLLSGFTCGRRPTLFIGVHVRIEAPESASSRQTPQPRHPNTRAR